ncbi:flagellar hook capping FlgD N-terminal domain-containing protein [Pelomonas sp. KK5]|uniref:flagellar hook capping FlgD N-terminal domain-containing protein n=1 Tax=Pelomonas sp. KK5 TaxID=1855730 RepID=UPI00097C4389|nr:flagellar hook capping FlgD N-terminal domain-containing protein [Pelomonas sp. KK5]
MTTTAVNNNTSGGSSGSNGAIASNGSDIQNMFTTLLVAQIKNQDPLSPSDPSAFVNQLTQLSQMEALQKLADQGGSSNGMMASLQMLALGGQVGSQVQAQVDSLNLGSTPVATHFTLSAGAAAGALVLTGSDGVEQRIPLANLSAGDNAFTLDPSKYGVTAGHYAVRVETDTKEVAGIEIGATLSSVRLGGDGNAILTLNGGLAQVAPSALTQFNGRSN